MDSQDNLVHVIVKSARPGRPEGGSEIPDSVRALAGRLSNMGESGKDVSEALEISQATVSKSSKGLVGNRLDERLRDITSVERTIDAAHEKALDVMMQSIEAIQPRITGEGVRDIKLKDLSKLAVDMSKIASNLKDTKKGKDEEAGPKTMVQIVVQPLRSERDYETILVG